MRFWVNLPGPFGVGFGGGRRGKRKPQRSTAQIRREQVENREWHRRHPFVLPIYLIVGLALIAAYISVLPK